jgi:hypothetical protein
MRRNCSPHSGVSAVQQLERAVSGRYCRVRARFGSISVAVSNTRVFAGRERWREFESDLFLETNVRIHRRLRSSASACCRASDQGMPADSPAITRRARRSISDAQAASTSAGLSVSVASRLANSSAATSARSAIGNVRASRRSSWAREVMRLFYILERWPLAKWDLRRSRHRSRPPL